MNQLYFDKHAHTHNVLRTSLRLQLSLSSFNQFHSWEFPGGLGVEDLALLLLWLGLDPWAEKLPLAWPKNKTEQKQTSKTQKTPQNLK